MRGERPTGCQSGLTLIELLLAMSLSAVLLLGLVQLVTAASSATRLQDNQASLHDRIRYVDRLLADAANRAGFSPEPWNPAFAIAAIAPGTDDRVSSRSDRLAVQEWSDLNCFDNLNPVLDSGGRARFYIRESVFDLNTSGHLTRTCRYGPSRDELVTQIRRQGLVPGVESFQLLFGEDSDRDGNIERWERAGRWSDESRLTGIRAGLLMAGDDEVRDRGAVLFRILDSSPQTSADGRLREAVELSLAIRGRGT